MPSLKKFVSCPGGGQNDGHKGGEKIFFFYTSFYLYRNDIENARKKNKKSLKSNPVGTFKATKPLDSHFKGGFVL